MTKWNGGCCLKLTELSLKFVKDPRWLWRHQMNRRFHYIGAYILLCFIHRPNFTIDYSVCRKNVASSVSHSFNIVRVYRGENWIPGVCGVYSDHARGIKFLLMVWMGCDHLFIQLDLTKCKRGWCLNLTGSAPIQFGSTCRLRSCCGVTRKN
jgi:hypothetical protein